MVEWQCGAKLSLDPQVRGWVGGGLRLPGYIWANLRWGGGSWQPARELPPSGEDLDELKGAQPVRDQSGRGQRSWEDAHRTSGSLHPYLVAKRAGLFHIIKKSYTDIPRK